MGIGIHKRSESAIGAAINAGTKAGTVVALGTAAKGLTPTAKKAFTASLTKQTGLIDNFQKSGVTVEQYMQKAKRTIEGVSIPGVIHTTIQNWQKKGFTPEQIEDKLENLQNTAIEINKIGTDKAFQKLKESKQLFETGQTSKELAYKDSAEVVLGKVKNKVLAFANDVTSAVKSTKGNTTEKLKAALESANKFLNNNPAIKQGGKTALTAGAAVGTLAFISKAISNSKKDK